MFLIEKVNRILYFVLYFSCNDVTVIHSWKRRKRWNGGNHDRNISISELSSEIPPGIDSSWEQDFIPALKSRISQCAAANSSINTLYLGRLLISFLSVASKLNVALIDRPRSLSSKERRPNVQFSGANV